MSEPYRVLCGQCRWRADFKRAEERLLAMEAHVGACPVGVAGVSINAYTDSLATTDTGPEETE